MKVSVSILSSSIKPQDIVKKLDESKADYIHLDIMDGKFVENKTWTYSEVKKIISYSKLPLDVHLMVDKPEKYIEDYAMLNTSYLTFHFEACKDVNKVISLIKIPDVLIKVHLFTLFIPINIVDSGASRYYKIKNGYNTFM